MAVSAMGGREGWPLGGSKQLLLPNYWPAWTALGPAVSEALGLGLQDWVDRIQHSIPITGENAKHAIRMVPSDDV